MLKKSSSQESLGQFQPKLVGKMCGGREFISVKIKGWHLLGENKG